MNVIIFFLCSAMSKCRTQGPVTTIHGYVTDAITDLPFANLQMQVINQYNDDSGNFVTTAADGSFYLKFTPSGYGTYHLRPVRSLLMRYYAGPFPRIALGQDNDFNIKTFRFVSLGIHLVNNSTQNHTDYILDVNELNPKIVGFGAFFELMHPKADTTFIAYLPQLASYKCKSDFFNGYSNAGLIDSVNFFKIIKLGVADTTVTITNP